MVLDRMVLMHKEKGIEGFPLRMVVISVIIALTVPVVYSYMKYYDLETTENKVISELNKLENAIKLVYYGSHGRKIVELNFKPGMFYHIDYINIGMGQWRNIIEYKISGQNTKYRIFNDPVIMMAKQSNNGSFMPLKLGADTYTLALEYRSDADINGDGHVDIYIKLELEV